MSDRKYKAGTGVANPKTREILAVLVEADSITCVWWQICCGKG